MNDELIEHALKAKALFEEHEKKVEVMKNLIAGAAFLLQGDTRDDAKAWREAFNRFVGQNVI